MLMIDCKDKDIVMPELHRMQMHLLLHKYLYYEKNKPMLTDKVFDETESYSFQLSRNMGYRGDKLKGPEENEKHFVHWMVGFDKSNPYWKHTLKKYNLA